MSPQSADSFARPGTARPRWPGGAALVLALVIGCAGAASGEDPQALLQHADSIKSSNNAEFAGVIERLGADPAELTAPQRQYLRYLEAWQRSYRGEYDAGLAGLRQVFEQTNDATLKFRAVASTVNVLTIARRYNESFSNLDIMLGLLPQITDKQVREQGLLTAAQIHIQVGQYEVALHYAEQLIAEAPVARVLCPALQLKIEALFKSGQLQADAAVVRAGLDACTRARELIFGNLIRTFVARLHLAHGEQAQALELLRDNYADVLQTHYPRVISDYDAVLAQAYLQGGEISSAAAHALRAVNEGVQNEYTEPLVGAYRILYQAAQQQGDLKAALDWHEKYAAADKGYIDDVSARQLAYQMAKSQAVANKLQIESLNKANQVLQLQGQLDQKDVENSRLYLLLLGSMLGFIVFLAIRIKRSQLHFRALAQRDGLTGIANRHHFFDLAERALSYGMKSARPLCVILLDLDHFKTVNDKYGHATGDLVLKRAVAACQAQLRSIDLFGRLGGEEFGILLADCEPDQAQRTAEQLRLAISGLVARGEIDFPVSASFGVASTRSSGYELRQLIADADEALYHAKDQGRDRVELFERAAA